VMVLCYKFLLSSCASGCQEVADKKARLTSTHESELSIPVSIVGAIYRESKLGVPDFFFSFCLVAARVGELPHCTLVERHS
jgi:hypothetical protein